MHKNVLTWKPQRSHYAHHTLQEKKKQQDHCNQPTAISTSYITLISTALQTWETCWSLETRQSVEGNKHVISCGIFSKAELGWAELQNTLNQNRSPSSAFLGGTESTSEAKTDSSAAARPCAQKAVLSSNSQTSLYQAQSKHIQTGIHRKG